MTMEELITRRMKEHIQENPFITAVMLHAQFPEIALEDTMMWLRTAVADGVLLAYKEKNITGEPFYTYRWNYGREKGNN